jgi:hypothetical protein
MSKRTRGSARAHRRPGARPPISRPAGARPGRPAAPQAPVSDSRPTALEVAPAIAEEHVDEPPAQAATEIRRVTRAQPRQRAKPGSLLAARAATEYVYVAQDLRRITVLSVILFAVMILAWLLIVVLGVIPLDFY